MVGYEVAGPEFYGGHEVVPEAEPGAAPLEERVESGLRFPEPR